MSSQIFETSFQPPAPVKAVNSQRFRKIFVISFYLVKIDREEEDKISRKNFPLRINKDHFDGL